MLPVQSLLPDLVLIEFSDNLLCLQRILQGSQLLRNRCSDSGWLTQAGESERWMFRHGFRF